MVKSPVEEHFPSIDIHGSAVKRFWRRVSAPHWPAEERLFVGLRVLKAGESSQFSGEKTTECSLWDGGIGREEFGGERL